MWVKRDLLNLSYKIQEKKFITRVWAIDGWCYIPQLKERQKFLGHSSHEYEFIREPWDGIIPKCKHIEELIEYHVITQNPLSWGEKTPWSHERFSETTPNPHNMLEKQFSH